MTQLFTLGFAEQAFRGLFEQGNNRMVQLSFDKGHRLDEHVAPCTLAVQVIEGLVQFVVDEDTRLLREKDLLIVEPNVVHGLEALEKSTILLTLFADEGAFHNAPATAAPRSDVHEDENDGADDEQGEASDPASELENEAMNNDVDTIEQDFDGALNSELELRKKVAPELWSLFDDHRQLYTGLQAVFLEFDAQRYQDTLTLIASELDHHFVSEEQILFPRLGKYLGGTDVGPVAQLTSEHQKIRQKHLLCVHLLVRWKEDNSVLPLLEHHTRALAGFLYQHIKKEDTHIFPMAGRIMSAEDLAAVKRELQSGL